MAEVFENARKLAKDLKTEVNEAFKEGGMDADEKKEAEEKAQAIRNFLEGKDAKEPLSENEKQLRESAIIAAIKELGFDITYDFLFPKEEKEVLNIDPESFWPKFTEFLKTKPRFLVKAALLQQLRLNSNAFSENLKSIPDDYFDRIYVATILEESAIFAFLTVKKWKEAPFAKEIFMKIAGEGIFIHEVASLLLKHVRHRPYAEEILIMAATNSPALFLSLAPNFRAESYGDRLLETCIRNLIKAADKYAEIFEKSPCPRIFYNQFCAIIIIFIPNLMLKKFYQKLKSEWMHGIGQESIKKL